MWILPRNYPLSSRYAQDMVESKEDLTLPGLNIEQSLMSRSKPTRLRSWKTRWKEGSYYQHLFGRILKPCQYSRFEAELTSSLAATHVSLFQPLDSAKAKKTNDTSGPTFLESSNQLDLFAASSRTSKDISVSDLEKSSTIWKELVIRRRGEYSARLKLAYAKNIPKVSTKEKEFLLWPTPTTDSASSRSKKYNQGGLPLATAVQTWATPMVQDSKHSGTNPGPNGKRNLLVNQVNWATPRTSDAKGGARPLNDKGQRISKSNPNLIFGANLSDQVRHWPTPSARDHKGANSLDTTMKKIAQGKRAQMGQLPNAVMIAENWPTPTVQDASKATKKMRDNHQNNLTAVVFSQETLPTPTTRDWKGGYTEASLQRKDGKCRRFDALPNAAIGGVGTDIVRGHLNPTWVEWLMGLPTGWTELGSWEMASSRPQPPKRGEC